MSLKPHISWHITNIDQVMPRRRAARSTSLRSRSGQERASNLISLRSTTITTSSRVVLTTSRRKDETGGRVLETKREGPEGAGVDAAVFFVICIRWICSELHWGGIYCVHLLETLTVETTGRISQGLRGQSSRG